MNCAPRQTLLLCVAALTANAAASEFKLFPAELPQGIFAGDSFALLEKGKLALQCGDAAGAEKFLLLWKKNFPSKPAALEAALCLFRKDHAGAEAVMSAIAADPENPDYFKACFFKARQAFQNGDWFGSCSWFKAAEKGKIPAALQWQSKAGVIQSLAAAGLYEEAEKVLQGAVKEFPQERDLWNKLTVLLLGKTGQFIRLEKFWRDEADAFRSAPDSFLFDGLVAGARAAAAADQLTTAEKFYAEAFQFAVNDIARRNCLKELIPVQEKLDADRAVRTIGKYLLFFPKAADAGSWKLRQGLILNSKKEFSAALKIFSSVLNDKNNPVQERVNAALYAALASEKLGDISVAREFYNSAIRRFGNQPAFDTQVKMQLLEFLLRTKEYASAAVLSEELIGAPGVEDEKLKLRRLVALKKLKRYAEAAEIAAALSVSPVPFHAAEGMWEAAHLTELQEKFKEARQLYLHFIERFPNEGRVPEAMLSAADFALQQQDFSASGKELEEFLQKFPRHESVQKVLLGAVFSLIQQKDKAAFQRAEKLFGRMKKEFSGTAEYDQAVLELARYHQADGNDIQALKLLEEFLKERSQSALFNEALYVSAEIFEKIGNFSKAIEYVDRILDKAPNSHPGVDAAMLGGRCSFRSGNYRKALKYYERAGELGGRGVTALVAAGEAADCHIQLRQAENLSAAAGIYRKLADQTDFPALRAQALYKLGAVCEQMKDDLSALKAYEELLALAGGAPKDWRSAGSWCALSARNALRILLTMPDLPEGSQRAQRICHWYSQLNLPGSEDELLNYLEKIRKHYNLLD